MGPNALFLGKLNQLDANSQVHQCQPDALVDDVSALEPAGQVVLLLSLCCVSAA